MAGILEQGKAENNQLGNFSDLGQFPPKGIIAKSHVSEWFKTCQNVIWCFKNLLILKTRG